MPRTERTIEPADVEFAVRWYSRQRDLTICAESPEDFLRAVADAESEGSVEVSDWQRFKLALRQRHWRAAHPGAHVEQRARKAARAIKMTRVPAGVEADIGRRVRALQIVEWELLYLTTAGLVLECDGRAAMSADDGTGWSLSLRPQYDRYARSFIGLGPKLPEYAHADRRIGYKYEPLTANLPMLYTALAEIEADPRAAYDRMRDALIAQGGDYSRAFGSRVPQRWERRHLDWIRVDQTEEEFDADREQQQHESRIERVVQEMESDTERQIKRAFAGQAPQDAPALTNDPSPTLAAPALVKARRKAA